MAPSKLVADSRQVLPTGNIVKDFIRLRKGLGGLMAVSGTGAPFPVKSAKNLMKKFRLACDKLDLLCYPVATELNLVPTGKGAIVYATLTFRFVSTSDNSFIDVVCITEGADSQDKAAGKAFTYGWKFAVLYSMLLPDGDVKEEWDDVPDTDDDFTPTAEPSGISKPVLSEYVGKACAAKSLDEWTAIAAELRARFTVTECKSVSVTMLQARDNLLAAEKVNAVIE